MRGAEVAAPELVLQTQQFSESSAWTTFSVTPSFLLVSGDPARMEEAPSLQQVLQRSYSLTPG